MIPPGEVETAPRGPGESILAVVLDSLVEVRQGLVIVLLPPIDVPAGDQGADHQRLVENGRGRGRKPLAPFALIGSGPNHFRIVRDGFVDVSLLIIGVSPVTEGMGIVRS